MRLGESHRPPGGDGQHAPPLPMVFFDIDNTLLDYSAAETAAAGCFYEACAGRLGHAKALFLQNWRHDAEAYYQRYLSGELSLAAHRRARIRAAFAPCPPISGAEADRLFALYLTYYEESWRLFPDVIPALRMLGACRLGVVSNGDSAQQRRKLQAMGIASYFQHVIISGDLGIAKPDRRIFDAAARLADTRAADCVYVGDHPETDGRAATAAGWQAFVIDRAASAASPRAGLTGVAARILARRWTGLAPR